MIFKRLLILASVASSIACQPSLTSSVETIPAAAIIGGQNATPQEFPFMINIWLITPKDNYVAHHCGGSLIHSRFVLTAAHCVLEDASEKTQRVIKPDELRLFLGSLHISGSGGEVLAVKAIYVHPQFNWPHNDVALIELREPVTKVAPVELSMKDPETELPQIATVIGWGLTDQAGLLDAQILQKLNLPLISREKCAQDAFTLQRKWHLESDNLCADSSLNQKASCPGDSGGPLLVFAQNKYQQIGIVSWGSACSGKQLNAPSSVEGHTRIFAVLDWIQSILK